MQTVSIPIFHKAADIEVLSGNSKIRQQDVFHSLPVRMETPGAPFSLVFSVELDPLADALFLVKQHDKDMRSLGVNDFSDVDAAFDDGIVTLENDLVRVDIDKQSGSFSSVTNKNLNIKIPLSSTVSYYRAFQKHNSGPCSGAYTFRPDSKETYPALTASDSNSIPQVTMMNLATTTNGGSSRVGFKIGDWVSLEYRLNDNDDFVEIEWTVGSIPINDGLGKEVILRFDTGKTIQSASSVYTDSNALEFLQRIRNHRDTWNLTLHDDQEFVAANYFPITTGAYIKDDKYQLSIATDRAQGAASLVDGQLEIMVHRRLLEDDNKGVGEHLNETETFYDPALKKEVTKGLVVRGNVFINVADPQNGIQKLRSKMEDRFYRPLIALRKKSASDVDAKVPWLTIKEFPVNVGLTSLIELSKECLMIRLSHLFSVDEHATLSKPVSVDFAKLFAVNTGVLNEVTELSLTGVWDQTPSTDTLEWITEDQNEDIYESKPFPLQGSVVELQAMEVRTFRVCFGKAYANKITEDEASVLADVVADLASVKRGATVAAVKEMKQVTELMTSA